MNDTDELAVAFFEAMRSEGVAMAKIGDLEATCITLLNRARNERKADSMLPLYGAQVAAERLGVCPRTVYNLAERHRSKIVQENAKACA